MPGKKRWTVDLCLEAVRRYTNYCKNSGEEACVNGYEQWTQQQGRGSTPVIQTIINTLGSWNAAKTLAARDREEVNLTPQGRSHERKSLTECLTAITRYESHCNETGQSASRDGYQEWHRQTPDTPSIGPIEHFGSWNQMRKRAAKEAGIDPDTLQLNQRGWPRSR